MADKSDKGGKPGKSDKPAAKPQKGPPQGDGAKEAKGKGKPAADKAPAHAAPVAEVPKDYIARLKK